MPQDANPPSRPPARRRSPRCQDQRHLLDAAMWCHPVRRSKFEARSPVPYSPLQHVYSLGRVRSVPARQRTIQRRAGAAYPRPARAGDRLRRLPWRSAGQIEPGSTLGRRRDDRGGSQWHGTGGSEGSARLNGCLISPVRPNRIVLPGCGQLNAVKVIACCASTVFGKHAIFSGDAIAGLPQP